MDQLLKYIPAFLFLATFAFLVVYVTWLFVELLRSKEAPAKSFFRWLRDLMDLLFGLG